MARSYWYIWTQKPYDLLGIQAYPGSDAEQGFFALENWVFGADFGGCATEDSGAVTCDVHPRRAPPGSWPGRRTGEAPYTAPEGTQLVCDPLANCQEAEAGAQITLTEIPVRTLPPE